MKKNKIAIVLVIVMSIMTTSVFASDGKRKLIIDTRQGLDTTDLSEKDSVVKIDNPAYMIDWTVGTDVGAKKGGGVGALILSSYGPSDNNSIEVFMKAESFKYLTDSAKDNGVYQFGLDYPLGAMRIIDIKDIAALGDGDFRFKFQKESDDILDKPFKRIIGGRPIVGFHLSVNDRQINKLDGGMQIAIPYKAAAGEDINQLALYKVDELGQLLQIANSRYTEVRQAQENKQYVEGTINEAGTYAVGYRPVDYKDVFGWYESPANFVLSRGIMNVIDGAFMRKESITRADLAFYLSNMSDQNIEPLNNAFTDVSADHPYAESINWAYFTGLIKGYEDKTFKPDQVITRQELAVMLDRYTQIIGKSHMPRTSKEVTFKDNNQISPFAKESVSYLQQADVIAGRGDGYFVPGDNVTRAECAKMITTVMNGIMDGKTKFTPMD